LLQGKIFNNCDFFEELSDVSLSHGRYSILTSRIIKPTHKPKVMALADTYPSEFLHAIGRLKDATLRPKMRELFDKHSDDLKFLSLYAWVLGQLLHPNTWPH